MRNHLSHFLLIVASEAESWRSLVQLVLEGGLMGIMAGQTVSHRYRGVYHLPSSLVVFVALKTEH
jgi:hypothetical protein